MRQVLMVRGRILGGTVAGLIVLALACTRSPIVKISPDADADWHPATGTNDWDDPDGADTGAGGDTGGGADSGQPEEPDCEELPPSTWTLVPQDTNGMATPVQARASVLEGWRMLDHVSIRAYEFLNYYRFNHPHPEQGQLALTAQIREVEDDRFSLHLAITSPLVENDERPPLNLVLSVDSSGSMGGHDLDMARAVLMAVAGRLRPGDVVSVVSWDQDHHVLLDRHAVAMPYDLDLVQAIASVETGGATDLASGLKESYRLAEAGWMDDGLNRVLVVTDGKTNLGLTDVALVGAMAGDRGAYGIHLAAVGVGDPLDYHDGMVDSLSQWGQGPGLFVADADDVRALIHDRFVELFDVAALDLSLELTLPPGFERADMEPDPRRGLPITFTPAQHLSPNRSLVLQQALSTRCFMQALDGAPLSARVSWIDPDTLERRSVEANWTIGGLKTYDDANLRKSEAIVAYAEALKLSKSTSSPEAAAQALAMAQEKVRMARQEEPSDPELADIEAVLDALAR